MVHPYPPHHSGLPYSGKHRWFLTLRTNQSQPLFSARECVELTLSQFRRAASQSAIAITAYCFLPDHVHLLVQGRDDGADCRGFIKLAKQYSSFYFKQRFKFALWQRYCYERVIRDDSELACTIGYIVANPVRAGLVAKPAEYPHLGSDLYSVDDLLAMCEYASRVEPDLR